MSPICQVVRKDVLRYVRFCLVRQICCCWMSRPTIWMQNLSHGFSVFCMISPARLSPLHMTVTSLMRWQAGFWNSTEVRASPIRGIIQAGWSRNRNVWNRKAGQRMRVSNLSAVSWIGYAQRQKHVRRNQRHVFLLMKNCLSRIKNSVMRQQKSPSQQGLVLAMW